MAQSLRRRPRTLPASNEITEGFQQLQERPAYSLPQRVLEVFQLVDADDSGLLDEEELALLLDKLSVEATPEEVSALHAHLDHDGSGEVDFGEFYDWYLCVSEAADERRTETMSLLKGRSCATAFESKTAVPTAVVDAAISAATSAVDHTGREPWRFTVVGPKTAAAACGAMPTGSELATDGAPAPGCLVVTCTKGEPTGDAAHDEEAALDDYASCCCAVQNFLLAMHAEGLGTRWTNPGRGPFNFDRDPAAAAAFGETVGVSLDQERIVAVVWYGFAQGGLEALPAPVRRKSVDQVRVNLP